MPPIHEKIYIYKSDRKKMIASNIKKEEFKHEIMDINAYKQKIFNSKKALLEQNFKVEKIIAFLPNTQLVPNDFQQIHQTTEQALSSFKKKLNFLNYYNDSEDYQIRLFKGERELPANKQACLQQLTDIQTNIKKIFLEQIDSYIDQYLDKVLK